MVPQLDAAEARAGLAASILEQTRHVDNLAALDHAIDLLRRAVRADHPDRADWLSNLSIALRTRFHRLDDLTDLDAAVMAAQEAVACVPIDHPHRAPCLTILGNSFQVRFERLGNLGDLEAAVAAQREAVTAASMGSAHRTSCLSNLAAALQIRYNRLDNLADLEATVAANRAAVEATPASDPWRANRLSNLGLALLAQFERVGDEADIDAAITFGRAAVELTPTGHPDRAGFLSNLAIALQALYRRKGNTADLDAAITAGQAAVDGTATDDPYRAKFQSNLGDLLRSRFERLDDLNDLDAAIAAHRAAVAATPVGHANQAARRSNLCIALRLRFERAGDVADIDAAISAGWAAVGATPTDNPARARYLSGVGLALLARFEQVGEVANINAAVRAGREAVAATRTDHSERARRLSDLCAILLTRFYRIGDPADLQAAIATGREATPADHAGGAVLQHNLSLALQARFERDGELADLDAAVTAARIAVTAAPLGIAERPRYLSSLCNVLRARFDIVGDVADVDAAVTAGQESVEATPANHPDRALYLSMYGSTVHKRFESVGDVADINAAVTTGRQAVEATPAHHPDRATYLSNLGSALRTRFAGLGREADLDDAIIVGQQAVAAVPVNHPYRARFLYTAGIALRARFDRTRDPADAHAAVRSWREAAAVATAPTSVRMEASRAWGVLSASLGRWGDAADGYAHAVALLPLLAWLGAGRSSRERLLTDWGGLAADAAACAVAAGQPDRAIELLELGRGVLWSQLLETRTDLTALRQVHPELAARLDGLRAALDQPVGRSTGTEAGGSSPTHDIDTRMAAARQWQTLLDQIRTLRGFHDFARTPAAARLRRAATGGAVVVVNISRWRCDALLVTNTSIEVKPLPALDQDTAVGRVNTYLDALQEFPKTSRDAMEQTITTTLEWLWDAIAEPVLDALGHRHTPTDDQPWTRLWWCPTGPLTFVPLHAAGHHDQPGGRSVLDRVVSSYTPTLRALSAARTRPQPTSPDQLLLIALPNTPGAQPLPAVVTEQELLTSVLSGIPHTVLADSDATRTNILDKLATHSWAHASCHGTQNLGDPATGGLLPHDWKTAGLVSVLDLSNADHAGGEFAFLSACKSATGGVALLDEAVNLAAALHYTGWRHVIGTLWSVWDADTAHIVHGTYRRLVGDGHLDSTHTAEALHHTLRDYRQRDNYRDEPSRWAPFLHTGP